MTRDTRPRRSLRGVGEGRTYGGESAQERAARRRRRLLDAGRVRFGTDGYRATTLRGLCREARVADRYFYEEFDRLEDLLLAVYHDCLDRLERAVLEALEGVGPDVAAQAHAGMEAFFACVEADPCLARVVWFEVLGVGPRVDAAYLERTARFGALLLDLVEQRGLGPQVEPDRRVTVQAVVGGVSQVVQAWVYAGFATPRAELVGPLVRFLLAVAERTRV